MSVAAGAAATAEMANAEMAATAGTADTAGQGAAAPAAVTKPATPPAGTAAPPGAKPSAAIPPPSAAKTPAAFVVVLDPGHGGTETGAEGKKGAGGTPGIYEKDITLDIARRLKALLQGQPGINVLLTREDDALVALDDRTALANQNHADLFVSIHVNSAPRRDARGAETYFLSYAVKDDDVRTLAAIENNAAGVDKEKLGQAPEGLELVLWDLAQSQYLQESGELAGSIQKELNEALGARNRGVRQAPFRVLMGATMPAVLVEVGFISNPAEETSLATEEYRDKIAQALSRAVTGFLADAKRRMGAAAAARTR
jgi:N-acetylmuramoyl-L-alanine amidase